MHINSHWLTIVASMFAFVLGACSNSAIEPLSKSVGSGNAASVGIPGKEQQFSPGYEEPLLRLAPRNPDYQTDQEPRTKGPSKSDNHSLGFAPPPYFPTLVANTYTKTARKEALPISYDLRNISGRLPLVRDQAFCNSCWAFASYSAIESKLLPNENFDFSEHNMFMNTEFDWNPCEKGNQYIASAYLMNHKGPVLEIDDPYEDSGTIASPTGLSPAKFVDWVYCLPDRTTDTDNDTIKEMVMTYGAVDTTIYMRAYYDDGTYNSITNGYYYTRTGVTTDHSVAIVGWDDNYAASNFVTQPPGNGAFILRNSWGADWGDSGYFYVSYYSSPAFKYNTIFPVVKPSTTANRTITYAPLGWTATIGYTGSSSAVYANIFTTSKAIVLNAVGSFAAAPDTSYTIKVYTDVVGTNDPTNGTLAQTLSGTTPYASYWTQHFGSKAVSLAANTQYAIVIAINTPGFDYPVPIEMPIDNYASKATASEGHSFMSYNGTNWTDMITKQANTDVVIFAYAQDCDDENTCTNDSYEIDSGTCVHTANSNECDDGNSCTRRDICVNGVCIGHDLVECVTIGSDQCHADLCNPKTGDCEDTPKADGASCVADDDGCTRDACISGVCTIGTVPDCHIQDDPCNIGICVSGGADAYICVKAPASRNGAVCDADGNGCTLDICQEGVCLMGQSVNCSDQDDACNVGVCLSTSTTTYVCNKNPSPFEGLDCDGHDLCFLNYHCIDGACIGKPRDCSDGVACTTDTCDPDTGTCTHKIEEAACNDQNPCTEDFCDAVHGCTNSTLPDWTVCSDIHACFAGVCERTEDNDTCATAKPLSVSQAISVPWTSYHAFRTIPAACLGKEHSGPDAFYSFVQEPDKTYVLHIIPTAKTRLAASLWRDCEATSCEAGTESTQPGEEQTLAVVAQPNKGNLIVQVLRLDEDTDDATPGFLIRLDEGVASDGDADTDPDIEIGERETSESISSDDGDQIDCDTHEQDTELSEASVDGDCDSEQETKDQTGAKSGGDGCRETSSQSGGVWLLLLLIICRVSVYGRKRPVSH